MLFTVFPLKAVNQIEFGMTAEIVREKMSGRLATGDIRARSKDHPTDYYQDEGAFFYYDEEGGSVANSDAVAKVGPLDW